MIEDIQAAIPLGLLLSFMIGPVFFVLLETGATKGFRAGVCFDIGVIIADIVFLVIAYFSSYQLLENLSNEPGLFVFGGMILLVYGIYLFAKKAKKKTAARPSKGGYVALFIKGFLLNFINIGVLAFWLGLIIVVGPSLENDPERMLVFFSTVILVYFGTDLMKILLAKQLKRYLTIERIVLITKGLGIVLIICGIVLITKGFLPKEKFDIKQEIERIS
ncbi:LysE family translocator [Flagellimonas taeanensis]|jgi:threonine/homoserine/homoserine lactone efflux protein|uniref:Threonine/homoserine/homoserine lactone efflux protein n=1 Tax=Flagellimonas taeanensis TaxID=1005926 RepID=A0A1M6Q9B1_9FLAO|nr:MULTISPECIES: LysE family transporter [Allomuricauda]MDC6385426.1 LysE family transporter [Muricauda sp. SK9]MEE1961572.1 LysE family transporter [Allomuricauda taeanensis]RIV53060.1 LysE family translocator [Allomuricauda taeanensis]SFB69643.1 Threonine/homoserine/homoserine lactone efflux protein [Allomuricauda taeanensis]SHK16746.1 Threonine/homoserine/homoserine lactone efflux protein [Allomuricauda taeanensis]